MLGETAVGDLWGLHEYNKGGSAEPGTPGCLLGHPAMLAREHDDLLQRVVSETSASNLSLRGEWGETERPMVSAVYQCTALLSQHST